MTPWRNTATLFFRLSVAAVAVLFSGLSVHAADAVTVGTVTANGSTVTVPVSIRDVSGTPLGMDRPAGSKIQSFSIKVTYAPASSVQSIAFNRAGITANLTPTSEFKPVTSNSVSLLATFPEGSNTIPFTLDAAAPGNVVAQLVVTLSPSAAPATSISLTLDSALTQLTDSGGTAATKETEDNGRLTLVDGRIDIPALAVTLSPTTRTVARGGTANLTASLNLAVATNTTVSLSSSNTSVATVPASVVIDAGQKTASVAVSGVAAGTAQITASLPNNSSSKSNITVTDQPAPCTTPAAPQLGGPASATIGVPYAITWSTVSAATEYTIEEATSADFAGAVSQTVTGTSVSYTHGTGGVRYDYRARAFNKSGNCNVASAYSATISVLIEEPAGPATRVLVVVGSTPGNNGSFFRTAIQLYNPHAAPVSGRIVFHRAGTSGSDADPSLPYTIAPGKTLAFDDLLPAMGLGSGLGSADLVADDLSALPVALARVFNDGGAAGTTGLTESALAFSDALSGGGSGVLFAPEDVQRFRLNIGVRSLDEGATLAIVVRDRNGVDVKSANPTIPPSYFRQFSPPELLDGYTVTGGETITLTVTSGSAYIYGSTTDNTTNDPSVQFAHRIE
ncbi:MAG TPA: Ig-like domain-containing protein [Thermoanaerobaculia bacterium]|nr:Ig-like domain-containing protein [Thermoanaerobaculia bacterium]